MPNFVQIRPRRGSRQLAEMYNEIFIHTLYLNTLYYTVSQKNA